MSGTTDHSSKAIDGLIDRVDELHSSPTVACQILNLLKNPDFCVREVREHLETDPALAAAILRLVNSSCFGLRQKMASLHQAVAYLGTRSLRLAILSFGLIDRLNRGTPAAVCQDYWQRALTMAAAASRLCSDRTTKTPEEAYSAGLLADVGVLAFAQVDTDAYVSLYSEHDHGSQLAAAERRQFGFDHAALGARLLSRWNVPRDLTHAVAHHHDHRGEGDCLDLAVLAADMLADVLWTPQTPRLPEARRFLFDEFQIDLDGLISLAVACKRDIADSAHVFQVKINGSIDCDILLKQALRQFKTEAMETAMDLDSLTAVCEQDYS